MLAASLVWEINTRLNVKASLADIFNYPTIRELGARISELESHLLLRETTLALGNGYGSCLEHPASPAKCILLKQGEDENRQLFFIHDGSGGVGAYRNWQTGWTDGLAGESVWTCQRTWLVSSAQLKRQPDYI